MRRAEEIRKPNARNHHVTVRGLQRAQLFDNQEQEDDDWSFGVQQVLPTVPETYGPQRDEVIGELG
jgi:hypothetical protein